MANEAAKADAFRLLHRRKGAFVIANPWDAGSCRILDCLGFEALATTSAGFAFSLGQRDNSVRRAQMLAHVTAITSVTDLPVSADLENGYGRTPDLVAETFHMCAATGAVGASIEDATGNSECPLFDLDQAVARVRAAVMAVARLPWKFTITARAENYLVGVPDLPDVIRRLQAYQEAGADVLFAPGVSNPRDIATLVSSLDRPVNVVMGLGGSPLTVAALAELGVRRISLGSALCRTAFGALIRAASEVRNEGSFRLLDEAPRFQQLSNMFPEST